jgi:hypothetical protein
MTTHALSNWNDVLTVLASQPVGTVLRFPKYWIVHPEDQGASVSVGLPVGQSADYRWRLGDGRCLHVRDFVAHYEAHVDHVHPSVNAVEHLRRDAPGAYVFGTAALGLLAGVLLGRSKEAALVGLGVGAVLGAVTLPTPGPR